MIERLERARRPASALLLLALALGLFLIPGAIVVWTALDPGLGSDSIPAPARFWHRSLSRRFEPWARARVASGRAEHLPARVTSTEWPLFGTVFYLLATEELEKAARSDAERPSVYAKGAIEAAADLVADPAQGKWVEEKWGADYRHREDVFYRYLLIFGLSSYQKVTGDLRHRALLLDQTDSLAKELLAAPHFLLDDYPGECWPSDCLWAVAAIRRADAVLGTDHAALVTHALLHLEEPLLDANGLPPYMADARTGFPTLGARGSSCASILAFAPELSPDVARQWYAGFERAYWQRAGLCDGFREYPRGAGIEWGVDVDAGPIVLGHGVSACCFGIAAARANGRFDHARPLAAEAIAWAWPLPSGALFLPQVFSDEADAPLLGEAGVLFCLTRRTAPGMHATPPGACSPQVYLLIGLYFLVGILLLVAARRRWTRAEAPASERRARAAAVAWIVALLGGLGALVLGHGLLGVAALLVSIALPDRIAGRAPPPAPVPATPASRYVEPDSSWK